MKKTAFMIAVLLIVSVLVSCSGGSEEAFDQTFGSTDQTDLSGYTFYILQTSDINEKPITNNTGVTLYGM